MTRPGPATLRETLSAFADRILVTDGRDPGDAVLPIAPERLDIYRHLVRANYRSMLAFAMTCTMRLLHAEMEREPAANGDADRADVVARFLATSPATTHSTREIADRFQAFVPEAYPDVVARRPELPDLMALERAELRALYHEDDPGGEVAPERLEELRAMSVEDFLALRVVRAPSASLLRLAYPVKSVRDELDARRHPPSPAPREETLTVGRLPVTLEAGIREVAGPGFAVLARVAAGETVSLEDLAGRWLSEPPDGLDPADEAGAFRVFGDTVLAALADGVLRTA